MTDTAFVICQVGPADSPVRRRADEIYKYIVQPVTKAHDLQALRSDRDPTPGQVTAQIVKSLTSARVVIADLTGNNPNVYYELGIAHSFGIPVVILVDSTDSLPFDVSSERSIEIGTSDVLGAEASERAKIALTAALKVVLTEGYKAKSLVSDAAGTSRLDELADSNPMASELAHVRDRLEMVLKYVSSTHSATTAMSTEILQAIRAQDQASSGYDSGSGYGTGGSGYGGSAGYDRPASGGYDRPVAGGYGQPPVTRNPKASEPASGPGDDDIPF